MTEIERQIYQEIFERLAGRVLEYIYRRTGNFSDAEDMRQDVFIALMFHIKGFVEGYPENHKAIRSWLFRTADYKVKHYWRNIDRRDMEVSVELLPELKAAANFTDPYSFDLPDWLTKEDKVMLEMKCQGYTLKEIASHLRITYGACRMKSIRLNKELKKYFEH